MRWLDRPAASSRSTSSSRAVSGSARPSRDGAAGCAPSLRRSSVPTCRTRPAAPRPCQPGPDALPWADAGGMRGFRGGFHRTQGGGHVGPQPVPPGGDDLSGPVPAPSRRLPACSWRRVVGDAAGPCCRRRGAGRSGTATTRGRAGGVTAVIPGPPTRTRGPSASVTTQVTSYSEPSGNRLCPVYLGAGLRRAGLPLSQAARPRSGVPTADPGDVSTRSHISSGRAATTCSAAAVSPVTS